MNICKIGKIFEEKNCKNFLKIKIDMLLIGKREQAEICNWQPNPECDRK